MDRIVDLGRLGTALVVAFTLATLATAVPPDSHTVSEQGRMHKPGHNNPYTNHCTDCHSLDLTGGIGPSCNTCHSNYWNNYDSANADLPLNHTEVKRDRGSSVRHGQGFGNIDHAGGTMLGVVFDRAGGVFTFTGERSVAGEP